MTYVEKYLKSFGKLKPEEIEIIKRDFGYQTCLLADTWTDLKKEIWESFRSLIK